MRLSGEIRHGRHCVCKLHVHLVFVTKRRDRIFHRDAIQRLRAIFEKVCTDFQAQLIEIDGGDNHVHLLVNYPPKHSVSALVNRLKGVSGRLLRSERPGLGTSILERRSMVAVVFLLPVARRAYRCFEVLHRTTKYAALSKAVASYPCPAGRGFTAPRINPGSDGDSIARESMLYGDWGGLSPLLPSSEWRFSTGRSGSASCSPLCTLESVASYT
jgi:putative transposase